MQIPSSKNQVKSSGSHASQALRAVTMTSPTVEIATPQASARTTHIPKPGERNVQEIDAGARKLEAPRIHPVRARQTTQTLLHNPLDARPATAAAAAARREGAITAWETPYNRPAFEHAENFQYTRLASQYLQQGRIRDAERLFRQALVVAERTFSPGDQAIVRALEDLAGFYYAHEQYEEAKPLVSRLLAQRVEQLHSDDWLLIRTVDQLAEIHERTGCPVEAQALYKFLLAKQEESFGRNSMACAFTLSRLADSYIKQDRVAVAEALMLRILDIQENFHGRSSIEVSTTLQDLSKIYHRLGRYDKAAEMLERLLHILESIHGSNGLSVASCLLRLADLLTEVNMVREADPLYRRAQSIYTMSYGDKTAAHSVFRKKMEKLKDSAPISKKSKDKPADQEQCWHYPAIRPNLEELLPGRLGTEQVSRCLGHAVRLSELKPRKTQTQTLPKILPDTAARSNSEQSIQSVPTTPELSKAAGGEIRSITMAPSLLDRLFSPGP